MPAKQGDNRSGIKRLCVYALLCAVCIIFGYVESLVPTALIAPGIKLGLSNSVALLLLTAKDIKGAFFVNITRILLSALLFGSPFSLLFSVSAGVISLLVCSCLSKSDNISTVGLSISGGVVHNITQTAVAVFVVGKGALFYLPVLIAGGMVSGVVIGILAGMIFKKTERFLKL